MRHILLIAGFLFCGQAWSESPSPTPPKGAQQKQAHAGQPKESAPADNRYTKESPLFIEILPTKATKATASDEGKKGDPKPSEDRTVEIISATVAALAGVAVAIFTGFLYCSTNKLWKTTDKSVTLARKEFIASHRPKLVIRHVALSMEGNVPKSVRYAVHNVGDSPATIVSVSDKIWVAAGNLPAIPPYENIRKETIRLESGDGREIIHQASERTTQELCFAVGFHTTIPASDRPKNSTEQSVLLLGYVDYVDQVGTKRQTAFLRQLNHDTNRFDAINHPDYEYQD